MDNILITICARGGSKGIKGKNIRNLAGYPLIYFTIKQAKKWGKAEHIVVSTDSKEISDAAKKYGADVPFMRPKRLSTDKAPKIPVIRHALRASEKLYKMKFNIVMDLDVTSPIRSDIDLEESYKLFKRKLPKTLFSIVKAHKNPYFNMVEETNGGRMILCKNKKYFGSRQTAPQVYDMNASIYIYKRDYLLNKKNISPISDNSIGYLMDNLGAYDIDSEIDFKFIQFLVKEKLIKL